MVNPADIEEFDALMKEGYKLDLVTGEYYWESKGYGKYVFQTFHGCAVMDATAIMKIRTD